MPPKRSILVARKGVSKKVSKRLLAITERDLAGRVGDLELLHGGKREGKQDGKGHGTGQARKRDGDGLGKSLK